MSKRTIFEEVGQASAAASPAPGAAEARKSAARRAVRIWLIALAAMVVLTVVIGGLTRLTDSGLSITEWNLIMGALPPLSEADWNEAFEAYKTTDEFKQENSWMELADFRTIFWWEWGHRFIARFIGVAWLIPLLYFAIRGMIPRGWWPRLVLVGVLGGLQGAIGWWMVWSGLSARVDVAPYRLMTHLGLAFLIFGLIAWFVFQLGREEWALLQARRARVKGLRLWGGATLVALFLQILIGALVAGTDGWAGWNTWPLMDGDFIAPEVSSMAPGWVNHFENPAMTQFQHRWLAAAPLVFGLVFLIRARRSGHRRSRTWATALFHGMWVQAGLGIATLLLLAPLEMLWLALLHQLGALALLALAVRAQFEVSYPSTQSVRG
ncbi:MAG: COX15/CtaA family protein [Pikeienuella sp.]